MNLNNCQHEWAGQQQSKDSFFVSIDYYLWFLCEMDSSQYFRTLCPCNLYCFAQPTACVFVELNVPAGCSKNEFCQGWYSSKCSMYKSYIMMSSSASELSRTLIQRSKKYSKISNFARKKDLYIGPNVKKMFKKRMNFFSCKNLKFLNISLIYGSMCIAATHLLLTWHKTDKLHKNPRQSHARICTPLDSVLHHAA